MMGYGMRFQRTTGISLRQRSRAFVFVDRATDRRLVLVVADIGMFFRNVRDAVLARLDPDLYGEHNVVLTATHTHAGVAGYAGYRLYTTTTNGFRPRTFQAIVDGVVESIRNAEADLAPSRLFLSRGELCDASVNRSPQAFDRNPDVDRTVFPDRIDPTSTVLRVERGGRAVGALNWFATHGTSLTNRNMLISGDNKGYAAWRCERDLGAGMVDGRRFVAAFAQTNAGDMSPNVPDATHGPTDDEVENARIIGARQADVARALLDGPGTEVTGGLAHGLADVALEGLLVGGEHTGDGREHRTGRAVLGAAFAAGTKEGPGASWCHEGVDANPLLSACSRLAYRLRPALGDVQGPKAMLLPVGALRWTADVLPVQVVRLGTLVLVALAQEVTIVAGLRLRRAVAAELGVAVEDVLVQGYANDYAGYVTTPEEYDAQRYEGGHTMFGRWELPAYVQEVRRVAQAVAGGETPESVPRRPHRPARTARRRNEAPYRCTGVVRQPPQTGAAGGTVTAEFSVAGDGGPLLPAYVVVERRTGTSDTEGEWEQVAADGDGSATVEWHRDGDRTVATATWQPPADIDGTFRFRYLDVDGGTATEPFMLTAAPPR